MTSKTNVASPGVHPVCDSVCRSNPATKGQLKAGFFGQLKDFFTRLFDTSDWPPRWHCGNWTDFHGWLYILSDTAIWAAYFAIPFLLFRIINKRRDIPFPKVIWLFIAFILLCGTTHLIDAAIFWWPAYRLSALVRFFTAVISIFTVFALYKILPVIYNIRTLEQLEAEIGERKKAEQEVRNHQILQQAAEELMAKKDEFMSIASHELKTPLTSVKASLQLLEKTVGKNKDLASITPFVSKAVKQTNKLNELITDLLDVTRIQAGKLELFKIDFNLAEMVRECVDQFQFPEDTHRITINGDPSLTINGDLKRIDQVLSNFLSNAIKYSAANTTIDISFEKLDNNLVKVSVTDHGIGIPGDKIENIFDRFYRVEHASQNFSGVGLGLYISSEIIKRHNGEIGVNSIFGKGSTFWFTV
jgi:chemotaxis family two-component system sensor kinase Cph1